MTSRYDEFLFTATTTAQEALAARSNRSYLIIQNNGDGPIRVGFSDALTSATGVLVAAGLAYAPYPPPNNGVWVIRDSTAGANVSLSLIDG